MSPQQDFITSAVGPAQTSKKDTGVPAAVTIAQAILESGYGAKHIGEANNYFGIKASTKPDGTVDYGTVATGYVTVPTREVLQGKDVTIQAKFRKYASMTDSFKDHGLFLKNNTRYATAFTHSSDPIQFAKDIAAAGYATDPKYADTLVALINQWKLAQYDTPAAAPAKPTPPAGSGNGSGTTQPPAGSGSGSGQKQSSGNSPFGGGTSFADAAAAASTAAEESTAVADAGSAAEAGASDAVADAGDQSDQGDSPADSGEQPDTSDTADTTDTTDTGGDTAGDRGTGLDRCRRLSRAVRGHVRPGRHRRPG